jgi:glycosyltransferase involved in cell wall biosynthesis
LPGAVLEAAAAGVPSVAFDVGGTRETMDDGVTGRLVPAGSLASLAAELTRLAGDPDALSEMGKAAREMVAERFLMEHTVERYDEIFTSLLPPVRRDRHQRRQTAAV